MNIKDLFLFVLFVLLCSLKAQSKSDSVAVRPINVNIQYAGNVGLASVGVGTTFSHQVIYLGFVYGYLPKSVNGVGVHTIAVRSCCRLFYGNLQERVTHSIYTGTNINYGITDNTYLKYPNYIPNGYYYPNAIHVAPFVGREIGFSINNLTLKKICIYGELGTIDKYVFDAVTSSQVSLLDILNLSFGISFNFISGSDKQ